MKKLCLLFIFWAADYDYSFIENERQLLLYSDEMYCPLINTQDHFTTIFCENIQVLVEKMRSISFLSMVLLILFPLSLNVM